MTDSRSNKPARVLFLEPYYGGSHKAFADGLADHSIHDITLAVMPARFWKWRMRGAALHFAKQIERPAEYDLVICSDMMGVADLKALWGVSSPPIILYMHENQLSYPVPDGERLDYHFAFTNLTSALVAERVVFNSNVHFTEFFDASRRFVRRLPEFRPSWMVDRIEEKSLVLSPGCELGPRTCPRNEIPLIIWNHRWEFDKGPERFFRAIEAVRARGCEFRLAILGENSQAVPTPFLRARDDLDERIAHFGFVEDTQSYRRWLERGSIIISTATQENFGISVIEAIHAGCSPLLPRALSYPEIIPEEFHDAVLYDDEAALADMLERLLKAGSQATIPGLAQSMERYSWRVMGPKYDSLISETLEVSR